MSVEITFDLYAYAKALRAFFYIYIIKANIVHSIHSFHGLGIQLLSINVVDEAIYRKVIGEKYFLCEDDPVVSDHYFTVGIACTAVTPFILYSNWIFFIKYSFIRAVLHLIQLKALVEEKDHGYHYQEKYAEYDKGDGHYR